MPFDAEMPQTAHLTSAAIAANTQSIAWLMATSAAEPNPELAQTDPARLLAMLYVSPRPCAALDALLAA